MQSFTNIKNILLSNKKALVVTVVCLVLIITFIILSVSFFTSPRSRNEVTSETPDNAGGSRNLPTTRRQKQQTRPSVLKLELVGKKKAFKVGETIVFALIGDTNDQVVKGYDAAIKFDTNKVTFVSDKRSLGDFSTYTRVRGNWLILTATQQLNSGQNTVLKNTKIAEIRFKAQKAGVAYFPLSFIPDSFSDSNLIDAKSNDLLTEATGITLQINP